MKEEDIFPPEKEERESMMRKAMNQGVNEGLEISNKVIDDVQNLNIKKDQLFNWLHRIGIFLLGFAAGYAYVILY